jgi:hypothetical protein
MQQVGGRFEKVSEVPLQLWDLNWTEKDSLTDDAVEIIYCLCDEVLKPGVIKTILNVR